MNCVVFIIFRKVINNLLDMQTSYDKKWINARNPRLFVNSY